MGSRTNKELKIRLADPQAAIGKLHALGARYLGEARCDDMYFNQPQGKVLKLTTKGGRTFKTVIKAEGDRFAIQSNDELPNPAEIADQLTRRYGVKRKLTNRRSFYAYGNYEISINDIKGIGTFLIVEDEDPQLSFVTDTIGIQNPEIIKDSFDNL